MRRSSAATEVTTIRPRRQNGPWIDRPADAAPPVSESRDHLRRPGTDAGSLRSRTNSRTAVVPEPGWPCGLWYDCSPAVGPAAQAPCISARAPQMITRLRDWRSCISWAINPWIDRPADAAPPVSESRDHLRRPGTDAGSLRSRTNSRTAVVPEPAWPSGLWYDCSPAVGPAAQAPSISARAPQMITRLRDWRSCISWAINPRAILPPWPDCCDLCCGR